VTGTSDATRTGRKEDGDLVPSFEWSSGSGVVGVEYYCHTTLILVLLSGARVVGAVGPPGH